MITADFEAYLTDDWYGQQITVDALLECEAEAGFEMAVVMPQTKPLPDNDGLLDKIAGHPRLLPCPLVDPHWGEEGIAALKAYVDRGAQGVKLMGAIHKYNVDDPMVIPFVAAARDMGIVVSIHSGRDNCSAERIGNVAQQVPGVPIIMDHMGFPDGFDTALDVCRECPDVYLGTTILRFHKLWAINPRRKPCRMRSNGPLKNWVPNGSFLGPIYRNIARSRSSERFSGWNWATWRKL